jgi:hypothetical protein
MQKVVGSNPIIRFNRDSAGNGGNRAYPQDLSARSAGRVSQHLVSVGAQVVAPSAVALPCQTRAPRLQRPVSRSPTQWRMARCEQRRRNTSTHNGKGHDHFSQTLETVRAAARRARAPGRDIRRQQTAERRGVLLPRKGAVRLRPERRQAAGSDRRLFRVALDHLALVCSKCSQNLVFLAIRRPGHRALRCS